MSITHDKAGALGGFADDLNAAIRENPVAAGLIGAGVLWMFFGGPRISALGSKVPGAARAVAGAVGTAAHATRGAVGEALAATGSRASDAARHIGDAVSSGTEGATRFFRDTASGGYDALASSTARASDTLARTARGATPSGLEFTTTLQRNLSEALERQPLLLGAIGLAIGAGIASAFPTTKIEKDLMGEAGARVKETIQDIATETSTRVQQVVSEVKKEAETQGLTPSAAKEGLKGVTDLLKTVAGVSRDFKQGSAVLEEGPSRHSCFRSCGAAFSAAPSSS